MTTDSRMTLYRARLADRDDPVVRIRGNYAVLEQRVAAGSWAYEFRVVRISDGHYVGGSEASLDAAFQIIDADAANPEPIA